MTVKKIVSRVLFCVIFMVLLMVGTESRATEIKSCKNALAGTQWIGGKSPGYALWKNTLEARSTLNNTTDTGPLFLLSKLEDFQGLTELNPRRFKAASSSRIIFESRKNETDIQVTISGNKLRDADLLEASSLNDSPREVYRFSVKTKEGETFGEIRYGDLSAKVDSSRQVKVENVKEEIDKLMDRVSEVKEIVFSHTHPLAQFIKIKPGENPVPVLASLSGKDIDFARNWSEKVPQTVFVMRAVTPGGISYSVSFLNGEILPVGP